MQPASALYTGYVAVRATCTYNATGEPNIDPSPQLTDTPEHTESPESAATRALALRVAEILADTPAADTLVLDIREISTVADFFVICSGENERQLRAISNAILERLGDERVRPHRTEGSPQSGWIVLDYGDVIVHVFEVEQRAFYRLESLWAEAPTLISIQ